MLQQKTPPLRRTALDEPRARILSAVRGLMRERPFHDLSLADVADAARVGPDQLRSCFPSRRELYLAAVEDLLSHLAARPRHASGAPLRERVAAEVDGWMRLLRRNPQLVQLGVGSETCGRDDVLDDLLEGARYQTVNAVAELTGLSGLAWERPEVRAVLRGYSGLAEAVCREWLEGGCLSDEQTRVLLEESLHALVERVLPEVLATPPG